MVTLATLTGLYIQNKSHMWRNDLPSKIEKLMKQLDEMQKTLNDEQVSAPFKENLYRKADKIAKYVKTFAGF